MAYIHKGMQGKIGEVKYNGQLVREIHVYINSSDFPNRKSANYRRTMAKNRRMFRI